MRKFSTLKNTAILGLVVVLFLGSWLGCFARTAQNKWQVDQVHAPKEALEGPIPTYSRS